MMTSETLNKLRTITYDSKGKPTSVAISLKNPLMRKLYKTLMEDFEDTMVAMNRQNEETIPWEEVKLRFTTKNAK